MVPRHKLIDINISLILEKNADGGGGVLTVRFRIYIYIRFGEYSAS